MTLNWSTVEIEQGAAAFVDLRLLRRRFQSLFQLSAVVQAGEVVVCDQVLQACFQYLELGDFRNKFGFRAYGAVPILPLRHMAEIRRGSSSTLRTRLIKNIGGAGIVGGAGGVIVPECSRAEHDDRHPGPFFVAAQRAAQFVTVHVRQIEAQQQGADRFAIQAKAHMFQGIGAGLGGDYIAGSRPFSGRPAGAPRCPG